MPELGKQNSPQRGESKEENERKLTSSKNINKSSQFLNCQIKENTLLKIQ
jgi:hypothetical protein